MIVSGAAAFRRIEISFLIIAGFPGESVNRELTFWGFFQDFSPVFSSGRPQSYSASLMNVTL